MRMSAIGTTRWKMPPIHFWRMYSAGHLENKYKSTKRLQHFYPNMQHYRCCSANVQECIMLDVMPPERVDRSHRCESPAINEGFPSSDRPIGVGIRPARLGAVEP